MGDDIRKRMETCQWNALWDFSLYNHDQKVSALIQNNIQHQEYARLLKLKSVPFSICSICLWRIKCSEMGIKIQPIHFFLAEHCTTNIYCSLPLHCLHLLWVFMWKTSFLALSCQDWLYLEISSSETIIGTVIFFLKQALTKNFC